MGNQTLNKYYFTFKEGHHDKNHKSLGGYYTYIEKPTEQEARIEMSAKRGGRWMCLHLNTREIDKQNLLYIPFKDLTKQIGENL